MAAPVVAQVDSISGDSEGTQQFLYGDKTPEPGVTHHTYTRVYEHYVQNNMNDTTGYLEILDPNYSITSWSLDEGWHIIPYWNPGLAMTTNDIHKACASGEGIRIDKLGFKIVNAQLFRTDIAVLAGVTELSNTFIHEPYWETYTDTHHRFEGQVVSKATDDTAPMTQGYEYFAANDNWQNQEVTSFAQGQLPRAKWRWQNSFGTGTPPSFLPDLVPRRRGNTNSAFSSLSTLHGGGRMCRGTNAMVGYGHTWVNTDKDAWYPFHMPQGDTSNWAALRGYTDKYPVTFPLARNAILKGEAARKNDNLPVDRGTNYTNMKHNRWQKVNLDTLTPEGVNPLPEDCFIKIQRIHDVGSPVRLAGRILVEYTCSISIATNNYGNPGPAFACLSSAQANYDQEGSQLAPYWTQGPLRKWRAYGIPQLPLPAAGTGGDDSYAANHGTIIIPPYVIPDNWRDANGPVGNEPIVVFTQNWATTGDNPNGLFNKVEMVHYPIGTNPDTGTPGTKYTESSYWMLAFDWDGVAPTNYNETRDAFTRHGFHYPALIAYYAGDVDVGGGFLAFVMEGFVSSVYNTNTNVLDNPAVSWLGPFAPSANLHHLFRDVPAVLGVSEEVKKPPKRRRRDSNDSGHCSEEAVASNILDL